jgi:hypothetical protein
MLNSGALTERFAISPRKPWPVIAASLDPPTSVALGD